MLSPNAFIENVKKIDDDFLLVCPDIQDPDFISLSKKIWIKTLQTLVDDNKEAISNEIDSFKKAVQKSFKSLSPLFKSFVATKLKYEDFPYQLTPKEFDAFVKKLKSAKTPAAAEEIVKDFYSSYETNDTYFIKANLRPYHPVVYMLNELERTYFEVETSALISSINRYIMFPQNKTRADLLCALAVASGMSVGAISQIESVKVFEDFSVKITAAGSTSVRPLLCRANHFKRAVDFMIAQNYSAWRPNTMSADNNKEVIGIRMALHHTPALHKALCGYFFSNAIEKFDLTIESKADFKLHGPSDLDKIIEDIERKRMDHIAATIEKSEDRMKTAIKTVLDYVEQNPTFKVGITSIRSIHPCSPNYATEINNLIAAL